MKWRYFAQDDGFEPYATYRVPDDGISLAKHYGSPDVQRLHSDGSWRHNPLDKQPWSGMMTGEFSEVSDEISEEEVTRLYAKWKSTKWPGR